MAFDILRLLSLWICRTFLYSKTFWGHVTGAIGPNGLKFYVHKSFYVSSMHEKFQPIWLSRKKVTASSISLIHQCLFWLFWGIKNRQKLAFKNGHNCKERLLEKKILKFDLRAWGFFWNFFSVSLSFAVMVIFKHELLSIFPPQYSQKYTDGLGILKRP